MPWPSRRRTLAVTGVLGAIAIVAVAWWLTHPTLLDPPGAEVGSYQQVGSTGIVGMTYPQPATDSLLIHAARARVHRGDGATVRVLVCRHRPGDDVLGTARGRLDHWCAAVEEPSETRLGAHDQLVAAVTADLPGVVVVDGIEVTYSTGWQRGTQATGVVYRARFGTKTVREYLDRQQSDATRGSGPNLVPPNRLPRLSRGLTVSTSSSRGHEHAAREQLAERTLICRDAR